MSWWALLILLGFLKLTLAGLMLWIPYRNDRARDMAQAAQDAAIPEEGGASEDDGGSRALPASPLDPHPHSPRPCPRRRGPHGSDPAPPSPPRVRRPAIAPFADRRITRARGLS
jgi:hypothetical protein